MKYKALLVSVLLLCASFAGCLKIPVPAYQSVIDAPRAKVIFSSPQLHGASFGVILELYIYDHSPECAFTPKGRVALTLKDPTKTVFVPANTRVYFRVAHLRQNMPRSASTHKKDFSYVLKENYEYTIEHIDNRPNKLTLNFFESDGVYPKHPLEVQPVICHAEKPNSR